MQDIRRSGVLLHITSLPGRYGIGTMNHDAYHWVDFLGQTHQSLWQVLPLGPTGYGDSPYQSFSSFAGNPYLISLEELVALGLLDQQVLDHAPEFPRAQVDFGHIYTWKLPLLRQVAADFEQRASAALKAEFATFCGENAAWLEDFALFMALKDAHGGAPWNQWEMPLRSRQAAAIAAARDSAWRCYPQPSFQPVALLSPMAGFESLCQCTEHSCGRRYSHLCCHGQQRCLDQPCRVFPG